MRKPATVIDLQRAQRRLLVVWYVGALLPFAVAMVQTLTASGPVGPDDAPMSAWMPALMPTLLLVTGVVTADALRRRTADRRKGGLHERVERFYFLLALAMSVTYLLVVNAIVLYLPYSGLSPAGLAQRANIVLAPLQGLVSAALGVFFVSRYASPGGAAESKPE